MLTTYPRVGKLARYPFRIFFDPICVPFFKRLTLVCFSLKTKLDKTWHPRPEQTKIVPHCFYAVILTSSQICECLFDNFWVPFLRLVGFTHYASFMNQVFYFPQWEWKPHIQHHRKLDDLWTGFEVAEGNMFRHGWVANCQTSWKQGCLLWQYPYLSMK